ncbi:MAG: hypothetical protein HYW23_04205 [Candidatus Aenigmarchaeota archaeon]|nr:hypothetical protein [Candidatus Aenigmarchaeota archaeon]
MESREELEEKVKKGIYTVSTTPRPDLPKEVHYPPWMYPEMYPERYQDLSKITSTVSVSGTTIIFEKPTTGENFAVSITPSKDNTERSLIITSNGNLVEKKKLWDRNLGSKDAVKTLMEWGAGTKEIGELSDFIDTRLRTVNIEKENRVRAGLDISDSGISGSVSAERKEKKETVSS